MTIGLLKEPSGEHRVALLPENIKTLTDLKVSVKVESEAGALAFATNSDYTSAGANITSRTDTLSAENEMFLSY